MRITMATFMETIKTKKWRGGVGHGHGGGGGSGGQGRERTSLGEYMSNVPAGLRGAMFGLGQITAAFITNVERMISMGMTQ